MNKFFILILIIVLIIILFSNNNERFDSGSTYQIISTSNNNEIIDPLFFKENIVTIRNQFKPIIDVKDNSGNQSIIIFPLSINTYNILSDGCSPKNSNSDCIVHNNNMMFTRVLINLKLSNRKNLYVYAFDINNPINNGIVQSADQLKVTNKLYQPLLYDIEDIPVTINDTVEYKAYATGNSNDYKNDIIYNNKKNS